PSARRERPVEKSSTITGTMASTTVSSNGSGSSNGNGNSNMSNSGNGNSSSKMITPFPFYQEDDDSQIIFLQNINRKDGLSAIKCCKLSKLIEKMTQAISFDYFFSSAFFLTFRDFTTPLELIRLLITRYTGPPVGSSKDHLRLFEIEVEIVQENVIHLFRQLIGTLNEKDFQNAELCNVSIEFLNTLSEDTKNELFLMFFKARKLTKLEPPRNGAHRPHTSTSISNAASTMRFSFSVNTKEEPVQNVLTGLLNGGAPPGTTSSGSGVHSPTLDHPSRSSKMSNRSGFRSKTGSSSAVSGAHSPSHSFGIMSSNNGSQYQNNVDEEGLERAAFPPEIIARELTIMEYELITSLTTNEFSQKAWTKEHQAANIQNFIIWFNRIVSWVSTKIVSKETPEERAVIIESFINIANHARELKNYNCVMEILASLHNSAISRLKSSWALVSPKANELFTQLNQLMSPDINFKAYRKHLTLVSPSEPCIPYLALFLTDYTYLDESNPSHLNNGTMVNIERIYLIGNRVQEFFQLFTNCNYAYQSNALVREAILGEKVWDENECFRVSKIREDTSGSSSPSSPTPSYTSSSSSSMSSSSSVQSKRRTTATNKYRMSFTGNDIAPSIASSLSERDWHILSTNATTLRHKKGKKILHMGEVNHNLYRVMAGRIKFENNSPEETRYLESGDIFGEDSFLFDHPMLFNVYSDSDDCEIMEIEKSFILSLFASEPILAATYYKHIAVLMADRVKFVLSSNDSPVLNGANGVGLHHHLPSSSLAQGTFIASTSPNTPQWSTTNLMGDKQRRSSVLIPEPSSTDLQRLGDDSKFRSTFGLGPEEVIIKSYSSKHSNTTGTLYITKHHLCYEGRVFGINKTKLLPFGKISKILPEKGQVSLTMSDKIKKFSFKSQEELSEAYGIMTKIWKNHFGTGAVRSPPPKTQPHQQHHATPGVTPPTPPRVAKAGQQAGELFAGVPDLPSKEEWEQILKGAKTLKFKKGEILVVEGTEFNKIFQIVKGECTIIKGLSLTDINANMNPPMISSIGLNKNLTSLAKLSAGHIFGEMSYLLPNGSAISVVASSEELEVHTIEGYFLNIFLKSKPLLAPKFYKYLACVLESRVKQYRQAIV
ncbi:hypothetical protein SAMD00019534_102020, partial [Acytostelium subglobosum LB1]|uniref:hypothetical protein n=1 Tax=Acytostelium subglobosum LB1 TaxID=1410327 RepID=UPI000644FC05